MLRTPDVDVDALARRLSSRGLDIGGIERVLPSLEDVFLDVVERSSAGRDSTLASTYA